MRIGVDLGTTNTVVAQGGRPRAVESEDGPITPSVVAFPPNGKRLVGSRARERRAIDPPNTIYSSKRIIGRRWTAPETGDFGGRYPFTLEDRGGFPVFVTREGPLGPEAVATTILDHVLAGAADLDVGDASELIVAVPAAFGPQQRNATLAAVKGTRIARVELIDEPVATARAFAASATLPDAPLAVFDLGGGTFELAVIAKGEVLGIGSDLYLGGDDIDRALADLVAEKVLASHRWDLHDNPIVYDRLVLACEQAKRELSSDLATTISLTSIDPALPGSTRAFEITREQLDALAEPILRRTFLHCDQALAGAALDRGSISTVLLAGGSSQLPVVAKMVGQYFGIEPLEPRNPMELVAIGASIA